MPKTSQPKIMLLQIDISIFTATMPIQVLFVQQQAAAELLIMSMTEDKTRQDKTRQENN